MINKEWYKNSSNYDNLVKIQKSVVPMGTIIGIYFFIVNYFIIGFISILNLIICIYISYLVKVIINNLIDILDGNK